MRTNVLTGLGVFAVVSLTGLTVMENMLVKSEVQYHTASFIPPAIAMQALKIPPPETEIIKYTVAYKDTLGIIAARYNTPWQRIYDKNLDMQGPADLKTGQEVVIPAPDEVLGDRPIPSSLTSAAPDLNTNQDLAQASIATAKPIVVASGSVVGNLYARGNCTWYVKSKRPDLPNNLGNANTWVVRARAQGFATGPTPHVGAVGQRGIHVVYVERVNGDGTVTISEMNYRSLYGVTWRTLPANYFMYIY